MFSRLLFYADMFSIDSSGALTDANNDSKKLFKASENCHLALASCSNRASVVAIHKNNVAPVGGAKVVDNKRLKKWRKKKKSMRAFSFTDRLEKKAVREKCFLTPHVFMIYCTKIHSQVSKCHFPQSNHLQQMCSLQICTLVQVPTRCYSEIMSLVTRFFC